MPHRSLGMKATSPPSGDRGGTPRFPLHYHRADAGTIQQRLFCPQCPKSHRDFAIQMEDLRKSTDGVDVDVETCRKDLHVQMYKQRPFTMEVFNLTAWVCNVSARCRRSSHVVQ